MAASSTVETQPVTMESNANTNNSINNGSSLLTATSSTNTNSPFQQNLVSSIKNAKLFVVGAGGIGCELLKNLVLVGFQDIHLVNIYSFIYCP